MKFTHTCNFHETLDLNKIAPIQNAGWNKPCGGIWLSINEGWEHWCEYEMPEWLIGIRYEFKLKPNAKVYWITEDIHAKVLPDNPKTEDEVFQLCTGMKFIDFEKVAENYDAIAVMIQSGNISRRLLDGWDCDSMVVFNPDIIESFEVTEEYKKETK